MSVAGSDRWLLSICIWYLREHLNLTAWDVLDIEEPSPANAEHPNLSDSDIPRGVPHLVVCGCDGFLGHDHGLGLEGEHGVDEPGQVLAESHAQRLVLGGASGPPAGEALVVRHILLRAVPAYAPAKPVGVELVDMGGDVDGVGHQ